MPPRTSTRGEKLISCLHKYTLIDAIVVRSCNERRGAGRTLRRVGRTLDRQSVHRNPFRKLSVLYPVLCNATRISRVDIFANSVRARCVVPLRDPTQSPLRSITSTCSRKTSLPTTPQSVLGQVRRLSRSRETHISSACSGAENIVMDTAIIKTETSARTIKFPQSQRTPSARTKVAAIAHGPRLSPG